MLPELRTAQSSPAQTRVIVAHHKNDEGFLKLPEVGAVLNDSNNLQWTLLLSNSEEKEITVKWSVEYPLNETIEYKEDN